MAGIPPRPVDVSFSRNYVITWAFDHIKQIDGGKQVDLVLDKSIGIGFKSKGEYLFGHFSMTIKMVPGDSVGVVTAFSVQLSSQNLEHDDINFEFLGNTTMQPYILQTNLFSERKSNREQHIYL
ncbi:xyloglucan endotransglucosylase protein 2-like [Cryptomeria japonica]|uniref:xyloglucan endotransglucosylase protein 2-like n=1 Tax=Cryptomeria japonica TaxID=3369 RepID=UPI0027DA87C5|nr:xyloglucan endotransglucosylase protein 2-like [Cryptomeria japonica]